MLRMNKRNKMEQNGTKWKKLLRRLKANKTLGSYYL